MNRLSLFWRRGLTGSDRPDWLVCHDRPLKTGNAAAVQHSVELPSDNGLGDAIQLTRDLNFSYLKTELRRLAAKSRYNDRLLKRAGLVRLLGPALNPEADLDLAFEILSRSLKESVGAN